MRLTLLIDNVYEDGTVQTVLEVNATPPERADVVDDYEGWAEENLLPHAGTGRSERASKNAGYFVKITACDDERYSDLVGREYEWGT